jgi:hypothetical protein
MSPYVTTAADWQCAMYTDSSFHFTANKRNVMLQLKSAISPRPGSTHIYC